MTTQVTITPRIPLGYDKEVLVQIYNPQTGITLREKRLSTGEQLAEYVHSTSAFRVLEIDVEPKQKQ